MISKSRTEYLHVFYFNIPVYMDLQSGNNCREKHLFYVRKMRTSKLYAVPIHYFKSYTFTFAHENG